MAEWLFRDMLRKGNINDITAESAGLGALDGQSASDNAVLALKEIGIDISSHRTKHIDMQMINEADLIVGMTNAHVAALLPYARGKVCLLGNGIPDPYGGSLEQYRICRDAIIKALAELMKKVSDKDGKNGQAE